MDTETCEHVFLGTLCLHCLCPETDEATDRALAAVDHKTQHQALGLTEAEAIAAAHVAHRKD